jgi:indolepyruvate ferredoxin oxidoreductase beta subunit
MKKDIILAGVGGQGILSIASVIDMAALKSGLFVKQSEVHGMSQRGGAVHSHLRISDQNIYSDLIGLGNADIIISVEPLEALRYLPYLHMNGQIVSSVNFFKNFDDYPDESEIINELNKIPSVTLVDADQIARDCGNVKASNMVILGAALPFIGIAQHWIEESITEIFKSKGQNIVELNINALKKGINSNQKIKL